jgi:hypothetical protein
MAAHEQWRIYIALLSYQELATGLFSRRTEEEVNRRVELGLTP